MLSEGVEVLMPTGLSMSMGVVAIMALGSEALDVKISGREKVSTHGGRCAAIN